MSVLLKMDSLKEASNEAESIIKRAKMCVVNPNSENVDNFDQSWAHEQLFGDDLSHHSSRLSDSSKGKNNRFTQFSPTKNSHITEKFDIYQKLKEIHDGLSSDETLHRNYQGLKIGSYLLEKLLARYNLNTLIINLYPGNKGYSMSLKINGHMQLLSPPPDSSGQTDQDALIETALWPYEEEDLLSYIDNEELPIVLLDLLEQDYSCLFYSGCIVAQVRDYRQAYPSFVCDTHHVLLKPSTQSIISDAASIASRNGCNAEEKSLLEAALVLATSPPLCLDPRPSVGIMAARLSSQPRIFNTPNIRRQAKKFSQVAINRKRKLDQFTHFHGVELLELINKHRTKNTRHNTTQGRPTSKFPRKPSEVLKPIEAPWVEQVALAVPSEPAAPMRLARAYERPRPSPDCQPQLVEEYVLETDRSTPHSSGTGVFHIKLSILQRPSDQEFLGELYVDRDHVEGERNGAACRFSLGTRTHANRYIQQFTEIFTEEGRKSVRIKHLVPGQVPRITYTAGMAHGNQQSVQARQAAVASSVPTTVTLTGIPSNPTAVRSQTLTAARSLPILQAQLQATPVVQQIATVQPPAQSPVQANLETQNLKTNMQIVTNNSMQQHILHQTVLKPQVNIEQQLQTQVHELQPSCVITTTDSKVTQQPTANQLLAQQLTNPPQPLNPQKLQPAIIHIQHPLLQQQKSLIGNVVQSQNQNTSAVQLQTQFTNQSSAGLQAVQAQKSTITKPRATNPAISALVTSLMNSAHQFQQAAANAAAAKSTAANNASNSNATILNLLNSAPAAMTHPQQQQTTQEQNRSIAEQTHKLLGRKVAIAGARLIAAVSTSASHVYTTQVVTGYSAVPVTKVVSALSVGRKSIDGMESSQASSSQSQSPLGLSMPGLSALLSGGSGDGQQVQQPTPVQSALLERLMAPASAARASPPAPNTPIVSSAGSIVNASGGTPSLQLQGLSIAGLQNVQVQIPGLAQPISLSLNVSGSGGGPAGLLVAAQPSQQQQQTVVLTSQGGTPSVLSLPIAQLMSSGVKALSAGGGSSIGMSGGSGPSLQLVSAVRAASAARVTGAAVSPQTLLAGTTQYVNQQQSCLNQQTVRRKSNASDSGK